jgi:hypothetical protein
MSRIKMNHVAVAVMAGLISAASVDAASIISGNFSYGFGKDAPSGAWAEATPGSNTAPSGGFEFDAQVYTSGWSGGGPSFQNRTIGTYTTTGQSGYFTPTSLVYLVGRYNGPAPIDAAANPNYQITMVIDSISVYAAPASTGGSETTNWKELSGGLTSSPTTIASQDPQTPPQTINWQNAAGYNKVAWSPDDNAVSIANVNEYATRYFQMDTSSDFWAVDGFEVEGHFEVTYDAIPEPTALSLLALPVLALRRRRHR